MPLLKTGAQPSLYKFCRQRMHLDIQPKQVLIQ